MIGSQAPRSITRRLMARELFGHRPGASVNTIRQFYDCLVPNTAVTQVDLPEAHICKFSPDGQYLICFASAFQHLVVYRYTGPRKCHPAAAGPPAGPQPGGTALSRPGSSYRRVPSLQSLQSAEAAAAKQPAKFNDFFKLVYRTPVCTGSAMLAKEFAMFPLSGSGSGPPLLLLGSHTPLLEPNRVPPQQQQAAAGRQGAGSTAAPHPASTVPYSQHTTLHLLDLSTGAQLDSISWTDDWVPLVSGAGVSLYGSLLAITAVRSQEVCLIQVLKSGQLVKVMQVGKWCHEDDELVVQRAELAETRWRQNQLLQSQGGLSDDDEDEADGIGLDAQGSSRARAGKKRSHDGRGDKATYKRPTSRPGSCPGTWAHHLHQQPRPGARDLALTGQLGTQSLFTLLPATDTGQGSSAPEPALRVSFPANQALQVRAGRLSNPNLTISRPNHGLTRARAEAGAAGMVGQPREGTQQTPPRLPPRSPPLPATVPTDVHDAGEQEQQQTAGADAAGAITPPRDAQPPQHVIQEPEQQQQQPRTENVQAPGLPHVEQDVDMIAGQDNRSDMQDEDGEGTSSVLGGLKQRLLSHYMKCCLQTAAAKAAPGKTARAAAKRAALQGFYGEFESLLALIIWRVQLVSPDLMLLDLVAPASPTDALRAAQGAGHANPSGGPATPHPSQYLAVYNWRTAKVKAFVPFTSDAAIRLLLRYCAALCSDSTGSLWERFTHTGMQVQVSQDLLKQVLPEHGHPKKLPPPSSAEPSQQGDGSELPPGSHEGSNSAQDASRSALMPLRRGALGDVSTEVVRVQPVGTSAGRSADAAQDRISTVKRVRGVLMLGGGQMISGSPFLDQRLFLYDDKLLLPVTRSRAVPEQSIRFYPVKRPEQVAFKIEPGTVEGFGPAAGAGRQGASRHLMTVLFHPVVPFVFLIGSAFMGPQTHLVMQFRL